MIHTSLPLSSQCYSFQYGNDFPLKIKRGGQGSTIPLTIDISVARFDRKKSFSGTSWAPFRLMTQRHRLRSQTSLPGVPTDLSKFHIRVPTILCVLTNSSKFAKWVVSVSALVGAYLLSSCLVGKRYNNRLKWRFMNSLKNR